MNIDTILIPYINPYWYYNVLKSSFTYSHFNPPPFYNLYVIRQTKS